MSAASGVVACGGDRPAPSSGPGDPTGGIGDMGSAGTTNSGTSSTTGGERSVDAGEGGGSGFGGGSELAGGGGSELGGGGSELGGGGSEFSSGFGGGDGSGFGGGGGFAFGGNFGSAGDAGAVAAPALHVVGNHLLDANGTVVRLLGVNHSGTEYACIQGYGIFDGSTDAAALEAIRSWHANAVRVPMNEDCWLGINGALPAFSGVAYQEAIAGYATRLLEHGLTPILELHWSAPGSQPATGQWPMPDRDHTPAFWTSVASRFGSDPRIVFELFNEPFPDANRDSSAAWSCWRDGGTCSLATYEVNGAPGPSYEVSGMQELLTAVRATGSANVVLIGGVQYANSLSQWLARKPIDKTGNLAAAWHAYDFNGCRAQRCWDTRVAPVIAEVPVVVTEVGEGLGSGPYSGQFINPLMTWLDQRQTSYLAWTWNTWGNSLSLIADYQGTPYAAYGRDVKAHLTALAEGNAGGSAGATGGTGGSTGTGGTGIGGTGGTAGIGGMAGSGPASDPATVCLPIADSGLITQFTFVGYSNEVPFGDNFSTLSGAEYFFPQLGTVPVAEPIGLESDVSLDTWHLTGAVAAPPYYSGFGVYFVNKSVFCSKIEASRFAGLQFTVQSNLDTPASITFSVGTAGNEIAASWLNANTAQATPVTNFGRCIPSGSPPDQYDGTCVAPSLLIPLSKSTKPTTVTVLWNDLRDGWPDSSVDPSEITGIGWSLPVGTYPLDLVIDDLRFIP